MTFSLSSSTLLPQRHLPSSSVRSAFVSPQCQPQRVSGHRTHTSLLAASGVTCPGLPSRAGEARWPPLRRTTKPSISTWGPSSPASQPPQPLDHFAASLSSFRSGFPLRCHLPPKSSLTPYSRQPLSPPSLLSP